MMIFVPQDYCKANQCVKQLLIEDLRISSVYSQVRMDQTIALSMLL